MKLLEYQTIKSVLKNYVPNWSEEVFVFKKVRVLFLFFLQWIFGISNLNREEIVETFTKVNCKNQIQKSFELKK